MPAGLYSLTNLAVAVAGTLMTSPMGSLSLPGRMPVDVTPEARPGYVIRIHSGKDEPIGQVITSRPVPVEMGKLPEDFLNAVIAAEDERFLEHTGVDPAGIAAAALDTLGGNLRGGSTISQQMVKNTLVGNERSLGRKLTEAMSAVRAHQKFSHQEILRRYLQSAWYGRGLTGVMRAPEVWFGKSWAEFSLAESATLAAMLKGPSLFDPWKNPDITRERRNAILKVMSRHGWIDEDALAAALDEPVRAIAPDLSVEASQWEQRAAMLDLEDREFVPDYGIALSTIDRDWQDLAEEALADAVREVSPVIAPRRISEPHVSELRAAADGIRMPADLRAALPAGSPYRSALLIEENEQGWDLFVEGEGLQQGVVLMDPHPEYAPAPGDLVPVAQLDHIGGKPAYDIRLPTRVEGAIVILDPRTGRLLATVGGVDAGLSEFDRTRAQRQPGSVIKPFLYLAALRSGFSPESPVEDIEHTWHSASGVAWRPRNYDHSQSGLIPMYSGLERSSNLAAAFLINRIGVEAMARQAEAAGVYPEGGMHRHISAALGTSETTLRDLAAGYAAIVNDGMPRKPHAVSRITDGTGVAFQEDFRRPGPVASRRSIEDLLGMMRGVTRRGTASRAFGKHPVTIAGKTGTTQDWRDAWFMGVTPHLVIGVWLGRDDNKPLPNRMAGGSAAAPIAADILKTALERGLIREDGLRDDAVSASIAWPPVLHEQGASTSPGSTRQVIAAASAPPLSPAGAEDGISGFWGGLEIREAAPSPENRNGDLLNLLQ